MDVIGWDKLLALPMAIIVLLVILYFAFKALPFWKEIKLAEIKVRETEAASRSDEASAFGKLSNALNALSELMQNIVVEQQRGAKNTHILQRVNADANDKILMKLNTLDQMSAHIESNSARLGAVEDDLRRIKV